VKDGLNFVYLIPYRGKNVGERDENFEGERNLSRPQELYVLRRAPVRIKGAQQDGLPWSGERGARGKMKAG